MRGVSEARFGSLVARGVAAVSHDVGDLTSGFWVVVVTFEGELTAVRMDDVRRGADAVPAARRRAGRLARGHALHGGWRTSLDHAAYVEGVAEVRRRIAAGTVYQVNLCRVMEHDLPEDARIADLGARLGRGQPGALRRDARPARGRARAGLRVAGGLPACGTATG